MTDPFAARPPDLRAIEAEWQTRYTASVKFEMRPVDGCDWDIQFDETKITNADDLEFVQCAFKLLRSNYALGEDGNGVEETAGLKLGGYFPPPPPSRFTGSWLGDGIFLCYEEDGCGQENSYAWFVWCGPCQSLVDANEGCCF